MYDNYSYLIHSAKGTSWSKKNAKYKKKVKVNGVWKYIYTDKFDEATKNDNWRTVKGPAHLYDYNYEPYAEDKNGVRVYDRTSKPAYYDKGSDPISKSASSVINKAKSASSVVNKAKRTSNEINKSREQSARVNGGKNLAESKERKAREQEAARREKVTRENRERDARINSHKAEMKNTSEARQLKEELTKRGYGNDIKGDVSLEYLRALESNTKKNRW